MTFRNVREIDQMLARGGGPEPVPEEGRVAGPPAGHQPPPEQPRASSPGGSDAGGPPEVGVRGPEPSDLPGGPAARRGVGLRVAFIATAVAAVVLAGAVLFLTVGGVRDGSHTSTAGSARRSVSSAVSRSSEERSSSSSSSSSSLSSTSSPSSSSSTTEEPYSGSPTPTPDTAFLATLPADLSGCTTVSLSGTGEFARAECGASLTQPGPAYAWFRGYPAGTNMVGVFFRGISRTTLTMRGPGTACDTATGYSTWVYRENNTLAGYYGCGISDSGRAWIYWVNYDFLIEGYVDAPGTTQADIALLYTWWQSNGAFRR